MLLYTGEACGGSPLLFQVTWGLKSIEAILYTYLFSLTSTFQSSFFNVS